MGALLALGVGPHGIVGEEMRDLRGMRDPVVEAGQRTVEFAVQFPRQCGKRRTGIRRYPEELQADVLWLFRHLPLLFRKMQVTIRPASLKMF